MDAVLQRLLAWMDGAAESREPFELSRFLSYAAYDITGEVTFSRTFGFIDQGRDIGGAIATNEAMELFFSVFGFYRWVSYAACNPLTTWLGVLPVGYMGKIARAALAERRLSPDSRFDIAQHWFRALESPTPPPEGVRWDENRLAAAAFANLAAGSDTVSCAIQFVESYLLPFDPHKTNKNPSPPPLPPPKKEASYTT